MNDAYVIDIADSLNQLEQDFNKWQSLQYDLRRKSDDACIQKYGLTNTQFYNLQRSNFIYYSGWKLQQEIARIKFNDEHDEPLVSDNLNDIPYGCTSTGEVNAQADKILASRRVEAIDDEFIVIPDWLDDDKPDYTIEDLVAHYNRYLNVPQDHKDISNSYSISIWNRSVPDMYIYMKSKFHKLTSDNADPVPVEEAVIPVFTPDYNDQAINNFKNTIVMESEDDFKLLVRKLDCVCPHKSSMYESHILESYGDKIKLGKKSYRADIPGVVPFLQYDEYVNNPYSLDMKKIVGGMFPYILSYDEKPKERFKELQEAWNNNDTKKLLEMGWNPVIKPSLATLEEARERQISYLDRMYPIDVYDISEYSTNLSDDVLKEAEDNLPSSKQLKPIFIVLSVKSDETVFSKISNKLFYDKEYSHVGVCFESTLQNIYTFDSVSKQGLNRMRLDSIDDYKYNSGTVRIIAFFVRKEIYAKMKDGMKQYLTMQDNSPYSFDNAFSLVADVPRLKGKSLSIVCGSFLDSLFKIANVYDQLAGMKNSKARIHFYILFTGNPKGYKSKEIDRRVKVLQKNLDFKELSFFEPDLVLGNIQYKLLENFNIKTSNHTVNSVLEQIQEILTPTDAYLEAATSDYSIYIDEILNSHKILSDSGEGDIELIKREISKVLYNLSKLAEIKKSMDKDDPALNSINLTSDIGMKDLSLYLKVVINVEKDFKLDDYIKGTPYGEELVDVDRSMFRVDSDLLK